MRTRIKPHLLERLAGRCIQRVSVLRIHPAARQTDVARPRVSLAGGSATQQQLGAAVAVPQADHHAGSHLERMRAQGHCECSGNLVDVRNWRHRYEPTGTWRHTGTLQAWNGSGHHGDSSL